ncbi:hypothetical protein GDO86_014767 [Hymenochirus boettgeri]|uniref:SH3 domain-containing protein n=1 Tax=Hymenochirus boettgeri TaxID=247094 RepID=A0A8T2JSW8_9PIPI|nr:hypothetical protein GDO86_014767 [Hymenochirus boettgeri]
MTVNRNINFPELQDALRSKLKEEGEKMAAHLSYKDPDGRGPIPVNSESDLQRIWQLYEDKHLTLSCKESTVKRPSLYQMRALYEYPAEGPEDLTFGEGDVIDILSEVNDEWLEGTCNGNIGIFPKCFAQKIQTLHL